MISAGRTCCQASANREIATAETPVTESQKHVVAAVPAIVYVSLSGVKDRPAFFAFVESPPHEASVASSAVLRI